MKSASRVIVRSIAAAFVNRLFTFSGIPFFFWTETQKWKENKTETDAFSFFTVRIIFFSILQRRTSR